MMDKKTGNADTKLPQEANEITPKKLKKETTSIILSPLAKRIKRNKIKEQANKLPTVWLSKADLKKQASNTSSSSTQRKRNDTDKTSSSRKISNPKKVSKKNKTFKRSDSSDSCSNELPTFQHKKRQRKIRNESFERYGIVLPSAKDIIEEQKDFDKYKKLVETASSIKDLSFELPFSVQELNKPVENSNIKVLDCKHLTLPELKQAFDKNFNFISGIFNGKIHSERHQRFHNYNKTFEHTMKDLTYSTSMIVFSFEQKEYLLSLLQQKLDPDDKLTEYFFKVLLPELCLHIFMDTHRMSKRKAVEYLDCRPVID